jgi:hypothetical protein
MTLGRRELLQSGLVLRSKPIRGALALALLVPAFWAASAAPSRAVAAYAAAARFREVGKILVRGDNCLGASLALDANGRIIAAASSPCGGRYKDTVLVFREPARGWGHRARPVAVLSASPADPAGELGDSDGLGPYGLAISADGSTIVAGDPLGSNGGGVYVFQEPSGGWHSETQSAYLHGTGPNDTSDGQSALGGSVAVSADGSVVLGYAGGFNSQLNYGLQYGAVNVYERPAGGWGTATGAFTAQLTTPAGHAVDEPQLGAPAISPDASVIVAPAASSILVYDEAPGGWGAGGGVDAALALPGPPSVVTFSPDGDSLLASTAQSGGSDTMYLLAAGTSGWNGAGVAATLSVKVPPVSGGGAFGDHVAYSGTAIAAFSDLSSTRIFEQPASGWANASRTTQTLHPLPVSVALSSSNELVLGGGPGAASNFGPGLLIFQR